jgi:hypothetical protein
MKKAEDDLRSINRVKFSTGSVVWKKLWFVKEKWSY